MQHIYENLTFKQDNLNENKADKHWRYFFIY